ncbi:MAG: polysaccharide biosynthesis tyrosine autokinase [Bacteroidales bacterium]|nr:polysaccharide biosynthesis tyrosine autokinase [Bacteroidales bacterium]
MENNNIIPQQSENIDIKKYFFLILRNWYWFFLTVTIAVAIAYLYNRYSKDQYSLSCSLIISDNDYGYGVESILDELSFLRRRRQQAVIENEMAILRSYYLAGLALEELDFDVTYVSVGRRRIAESFMYTNSPFVVTYDSIQRVPVGRPVYVQVLSKEEYALYIKGDEENEYRGKFGEGLDADNMKFTINLRSPGTFSFNPNNSNRFYFIINDKNSLINRFSKRLELSLNDEKGTVLTLSMKGYVPQQLADYLNTISRVYIQNNLDIKNEISINAIHFIDEQLSSVVDSLDRTSFRLQSFRSQNRLINLSQEGTTLYKELDDYTKNKALLQLNQNYYNYLLDYIKTGSDLSDITVPSIIGINDATLNSLVNDLIDLYIKKRQYQFTLQENNPKLAETDYQINNIKKGLEENIRNLIQSNKLQIAQIDKKINQIENQVEAFPYTERQMLNIQREFNINDEIYTFLLQKRAEAGIKKASNTSDSRMLDSARPENAALIAPKKQNNLMMAFLAGILIPLVIILLKDLLNDRIRDRKEIEHLTKIPIIGSIGHNTIDTDIPVHEKPKSALAESYRSLRANLSFMMKAETKQIIAITSTISGEGKSFCAVNLAVIFALAGKKTLLLSMDLRKPRIHKMFDAGNEKGLSTLFIGQSKLEEIILPTHIENLSIITSGPIPPNPAELIESDNARKFFASMKEKYDMVIIDTPPVAIVSDAISVGRYADINLFVMRQNYTSREVVKLLNELNEKSILGNLAIVFNDVHFPGYYGYNYHYGYSYRYGYNYGYGQGYYGEEPIKRSFLKKLFMKG